jgi:hypothetical protein
MPVKPNVFLIGGCRSGTTSLSRYLGAHPEVCWAAPKGPGYFSFDFENYRYVKTLDEYDACFAGATGAHKVLAEGATWYLYSEQAVPRILEYNSDARFLAIIRNPIEQIQSFHNILVTQGNETITDFTEAWEAQERRRAGIDIPRNCRDVAFLQYGDVARFGTQLERVIGWVGEDRISVTLYDDYIRDPKTCYESILEFLDLSPDDRADFPVTMPNQNIRSQFLARLTHQPSFARVAAADAIKKTLGIRSLGFSEILSRINTRTQARSELATGITTRLREHYKGEIEILSSLMHRDLGHWLA